MLGRVFPTMLQRVLPTMLQRVAGALNPYLAIMKFIDGFHVTSSTLCWWTKTKDLSLASFVRPPAFVHYTIVI